MGDLIIVGLDLDGMEKLAVFLRNHLNTLDAIYKECPLCEAI
jgi:hypothetical protein